MRIEMPYVQIIRARGRDYAYYRRAGDRIRIPGVIGSWQWRQEYDRIHGDFERVAASRTPGEAGRPGSLEALWRAYVASPDYRRLRPGTQRGYAGVIEPVIAEWGHNPVLKVTRAWVQERLDELGDTPRKANSLLAVLRLVLNWGAARDWLRDNPAKLVKPVRYARQKHRIWSQAEIDAMTAPDSPVALAVMIGLYTGQRLGDVLALRWDQLSGDALRLTQSKTAADLVVPIHPTLAAELAEAPRSDDTIATRPDGARWKIDHFKHVFIAERRKRGLPESVHFHGLRHVAASRLSEAGASTAEIAAITGHKSTVMVEHYTSGARQERLARGAMGRMGKGDER